MFSDFLLQFLQKLSEASTVVTFSGTFHSVPENMAGHFYLNVALPVWTASFQICTKITSSLSSKDTFKQAVKKVAGLSQMYPDHHRVGQRTKDLIRCINLFKIYRLT